MDDSEQVMQLIAAYWPDEYLISGQENVKNIVEDAIAGTATEENFAPLAVGDDFDILVVLGTILAAAELILDIMQFLSNMHKDKTDSVPAHQSAMKTAVDNYVGAVNSKAWKLLNAKQRAEFTDRLIEISLGSKK